MIVWCGRCNEHIVDLSMFGGVTAIDWAGMTAERPWCELCSIWAICQWPRIGIGVAQAVTKRQMRDADTCRCPCIDCSNGAHWRCHRVSELV